MPIFTFWGDYELNSVETYAYRPLARHLHHHCMEAIMDKKKKEQLKKKINRTIDKYDEKISVLDQKSKAVSEGVKSSLHNAIADVKKKQEALKERSKEAAGSGSGALSEIKTGFKSAARDLKTSFKNASKELKKSKK